MSTQEEKEAAPSVLSWVRHQSWPVQQDSQVARLAVVDLFCGCGGLTLGAWEAARLRSVSLDVRLAVDTCDFAMAVYRTNFSVDQKVARQDDVARIFDGMLGSPLTTIEAHWRGRAGHVDALIAGPPCQGHSDLNNSTRRCDPRNRLYLRVVRAAEVIDPAAVLIENVPAVVHDSEGVVEHAVRQLRAMGFFVDHGVVSMTDFGVPQARRRHVLIAAKGCDVDVCDMLQDKSKAPAAGQFLEGLEDEPEAKNGVLYRAARPTPENQSRINFLFDNDLHDLPNSQRPSCHRDKEHRYCSMYGRMHENLPAQTITSGFGSMGQGRFVHPSRRRLITPHEAARLQGFPDFFEFSQTKSVTALRRMIGNAVPPQLGAAAIGYLIDTVGLTG